MGAVPGYRLVLRALGRNNFKMPTPLHWPRASRRFWRVTGRPCFAAISQNAKLNAQHQSRWPSIRRRVCRGRPFWADPDAARQRSRKGAHHTRPLQVVAAAHWIGDGRKHCILSACWDYAANRIAIPGLAACILGIRMIAAGKNRGILSRED